MKLLIIIVLLFCAHNLWAQNSINYFSNFTNLERIVDLSSYGFKPNFENLKYNSCPNGIVFCGFDASIGIDSIQIMVLNTKDMKIKLNMFYIKGLSKYLLKKRYQSIDYIAKNSKWTVIGVYKRIYIFDNENLYKVINHEKEYYNAKFISKNGLILFTNRNRKKHNTIISKYDIIKNKIIKEVYPQFNMIEYTHISGNQWFDVTHGSILFSQTISYRIDLYNSKLEAYDFIQPIDSNWRELPINIQQEIKNSNYSGIDAIRAILPYEKDISRMEQVFFFNDTTIITYYNTPDGNRNYIERKHEFDIWKKEDNVWKRKHIGYQDLYKNGVLSNSNYPIFVGKLSRSIVFSDGYLFAFMPFAPLSPDGYEKNIYLKKCDDYFLKKSPKPLIYIYSVKF